MNRQAKRLLAKQKMTGQDRMEAMRERRSVTAGGGGVGGRGGERKRTSARVVLKQVRQELKKVAWPSHVIWTPFICRVCWVMIDLANLVLPVCG